MKQMKFSNCSEAGNWMMKHLNIPHNVKTVFHRRAVLVPATKSHPAIPSLEIGVSFSYHGKDYENKFAPMTIPVEKANWTMEIDENADWHFLNEKWETISEEEYMDGLKKFLKE